MLWKHLRAKRLEGLKFRHQQPIGRFVVDFVCYDEKLVIELDGGQHAKNKSDDVKRDRWLQRHGFRVLRFWNNEVLCNINGILESIKAHYLTLPFPPPIKGGGVKWTYGED